MPKRRFHAFGILAAAIAWTFAAGEARAAGEWEWTRGQGWVMGAGVSRPTPKEQLHYAYQLEQKGEYMDSARQYFLLIQNFPDSQEAGVGLQRLAKCLFEMENYFTAYKAIEQVIETYPGTGRMSDLVEIELRIAKKMMLSETPDLLSEPAANPRNANVKRALEIVGSVIKHDPYGPLAAEAYLVKGEGGLFVGELADARAAFETVRDEFPRSDFVERARLGLLRCDSLVGQARPQEVYEQAQVVREAEAERQKAGRAGREELDEVETSMRQMAEVEAGKMLEQAEQYRRMGTRAAVQSSEFLYKEIARRYPGTPQADEANERLGKLKIPKEQGKLAKSIKNINLNPFTWNKDVEPPWIVPQIDPEEMVMVDSGLGPIMGVPETGLPPNAGAAAGVRPAALDASASFAAASNAPFSPASAAPDAAGFSPAPTFIDATGRERTYASDPRALAGPPSLGGPGMVDIGPSRAAAAFSASPNPLPSISESDLIPVDGGTAALAAAPRASFSQPMGGYGSSYQPPETAYSPPPVMAPAPAYSGGATYAAPLQEPRIGSIANAPLSDLVGPASPAANAYQAAPAYAEPLYRDPYTPPAQNVYDSPPPTLIRDSGGGWTLGDDFR